MVLSSPQTAIMTEFLPFNGWRYDSGKVSYREVLAPPYDVISPAEQGALYERSAYNCIRLILNRPESGDTPEQNGYTRARDFFSGWQREGVLTQETTPAYYLYRQIFRDPVSGKDCVRTALIGRLRLEPFDKGIVVPHEKTLSRPRADRMRLLETARVNFSPVFGLYEDNEQAMAALYQEILKQEPAFDVPDDKGVQHAVWPLENSELQDKIRKLLSSKKIYIADGHHRYQTALDYAMKKRGEAGNPPAGSLGSDYVMMALVEFHDPGLVLYPTHRLLRKEGVAEIKADLMKALESSFTVRQVKAESLETEITKAAGGKTSFGLLFPDKAFVLELKDFEEAKSRMPEGHADLWYRLDVNLVSHLILKSLWGIPEERWESVLFYTHSFGEAQACVEKKEAGLAFVLPAPRVEILRDMGAVRELMAQKSTYFYPKLASGLVFYAHENGEK